jgi:hypothetical protein
MKPLILTGCLIPDFIKADVADLAVDPYFRFVWGQLPSPDELAAYLGPRTSDNSPAGGRHWSDFASRWGQSKNKSLRDLSLAEFCQQYETVELWFDTRPHAQLQLIWLLDYFRSYPDTVARLKLRLLDQDLIGMSPGGLGEWRPPLIDVTEQELATASVSGDDAGSLLDHCRPTRSLQRYWPRGRHKSQGFIGSIIDSRATSNRLEGKSPD